MLAATRRPYDWTEIWHRHLNSYLGAKPRAGLVIEQTLSGHFDTALEIACGSARDSLYLQGTGKDVVATDGNADVISTLQKRFRGMSNIDFRVEDALSLSFDSRRFDVSFHSGFYVCFDNDDTIKALLREQCRVTKRHVFFFVHNAHNRALRERFRAGASSDNVFDIRFFGRDEIEKLVNDSGVTYQQMRIATFGGPFDMLLNPQVRGFHNPFCRFASMHLPLLYSMTPLRTAERLACHLVL
jgi:SAM-dependent methyltransferase